MKKIFLILFASVLLFSPVALVYAQGLGGALPALNNTLGSKKQGLAPDLQTGVGNIIGGALALVGTIFLILTVYGGITWMIAMGNADKTQKAQEIITAAIIGLAITMGAYAITIFVTARLQSNSVPGCCAFTSTNLCSDASSGGLCQGVFYPGKTCESSSGQCK